MIRLQDLTPAVYCQQSRDFQYIGRLYDVVLNYSKTNADALNSLPVGKSMNESLLNLLSMSLGFKTRHAYNAKQLTAVCGVLPIIMRQKGSLNAIITAVNAMLVAEGLTQPLDYSIAPKEKITLYLPQQLTDLALLQDLISYILPAGMGCSFVREISKTHEASTTFTTKDEVEIYKNIEQKLPVVGLYDESTLSAIARVSDTDALPDAGISKLPGAIANSTVAQK
jgi:hypothetical protein